VRAKVQVNYTAYGLKIAGISSRKMPDPAEGNILNKFLYNDKELIDDADLNWYDYGFRSYDPQIGRFPQLDPLTFKYPELTPYQFTSCNPIDNVDVDGLEASNITKPFQDALSITLSEVIVGAKIIPKIINSFAVRTFTTVAIATTSAFIDDLLGRNSAGWIANSKALPTTMYDTWNNSINTSHRIFQAAAPWFMGTGASITGGALIVTAGTAGFAIEVTAPVAVAGAGMMAIGSQLSVNSTMNLANGNGLVKMESAPEQSSSQTSVSESPYSKSPPAEGANKLKNGQGWRDKDGNIWKKDQLHKDHWDVSDAKGNKIREVDFNNNQIWPNGAKNKNK